MKSRDASHSKSARGRIAAIEDETARANTVASGHPGFRAVLYLVFALSGLTGLVYEATWTRYLQLFLGHAAYAQVLVIFLFMGGMGVGALLASRLSRARLAPLVAYASIEAALGLAALIFHPLFHATTTFAYDVLLPGTQGSTAALVMQWLLASALIIPQSILLGMTFPLMSAAVLRLGRGAGGRVFAMLYFANSAGAVIGVLLAGFWLIESYGLQITMMMAGAGNLLVAAVAWLTATRRTDSAPAVVRPVRSEGVGRWLLAFTFLTAVASFLYEIAWLRMLALVQGASTHAFETMLSAFILGIALGGLWIRGRIERYKSPLSALARVQIFMGLAALATLPAYNYAFDLMQLGMARLPRTGLGYLGYNVVGYLISAGIMVPASFFAGMTLPLLTFVLYARGRGESEIGAVYGWNTLGGIAGIALGGLVLMPLVGLKNMVILGAGVDIALGIALTVMLMRRGEMPARWPSYALAAVSLVALISAQFAFEFDVTRMAAGVFRHGSARLSKMWTVVHHADGRTATVNLVKQSAGGNLSITTNGKADAAINIKRALGNHNATPGSDEYTMTLLAVLPLAHAPGTRKVAIIGHGSGLTTHVVLGSPSVERVDEIEIEPEMIRAARAFLPRVARTYYDPRVRFIIEDARSFFARAAPQYDVIISEPSNPWVSGVASLYTPEFYRQARRALAPGGLFVQWFHLYEIDRPQVTSIVRGIGMVFPEYVLYAANDTDLILVATASAKVPPLTDEVFVWPNMRAELEYLDIRTPAQLRLFRIASRKAYAPLLEVGRLNSDYFPYLEFSAARARFLSKSDLSVTQLARDPMPLLEILSGFDAPTLPQTSLYLAAALPRFLDVRRANLFAAGLANGGTSLAPETSTLSVDDRTNLGRARNLQLNRSAEAWQEWFSALFFVSKPMIPNGGAAALENFIRSGRIAGALHHAPPAVGQKVEYLMLVGRRDLERMRTEGLRLLDGPLRELDPAFHAYVFVATAAACLVTTLDAPCRAILLQFDQVYRPSPVFDLLRAHRALQH
jgi:spermidine synthase